MKNLRDTFTSVYASLLYNIDVYFLFYIYARKQYEKS